MPGAIDSHCHLYVTKESVSRPILDGCTELFGQSLGQLGRAMEPAALRMLLERECEDPGGERAIGKMEAAGIEKSFVLVGGFGFDPDAPDEPFERQNRDTARLTGRWPDRLLGFAGIHPRLGEPLGVLKRCVEEWGMRGLKLDPLAGRYDPTDPALAPVYRYAAEHALPIVFHSGPRPEDPDSDYAHPRRIAAVLEQFPDLRVVAAHMSFRWWRQFCEVAQRTPQLMCDISAFQMTAALNKRQLRHVLRRVLDAVGADRVLFGVDGPFFDIFFDRREWLALVRALPRESDDGLVFRDDEIAKIVGRNAEALLAGAPPPVRGAMPHP